MLLASLGIRRDRRGTEKSLTAGKAHLDAPWGSLRWKGKLQILGLAFENPTRPMVGPEQCLLP